MAQNMNTTANEANPALRLAQHEDPDAHVVQLYVEDEFLLEEVSALTSAALQRGDSAVVVATPAHRGGITQKLRARGVDTIEMETLGRYTVLDAEETLGKFADDGELDEKRFSAVLGAVLDSARRASRSEQAQVAVFGEMVDLLWSQGKHESAIRLEQMWNDLARVHSFTLRCAYSLEGFDRVEDGEFLRRICTQHSAVIPCESYTALDEGERLRNVAYLQQRTQALASERQEHRQTQHTLERRNAELSQTLCEMEESVEQRTVALRRLSAQVLSLQDSERRRVAHELHDSLAQYLAILKLNMALLKRTPSRLELWEQSDELMEHCIAEMRTLSHLLHPPLLDEAGLLAAVRWYVEGFGQRTGIRVKLETGSLERLPQVVELTLFRALQEALTNTHRHARASEAEVRLAHDAEHVMLEVKDDGRGLPQELLAQLNDGGKATGIGLAAMRERVRELGGALVMKSGADGTELLIMIPLDESMQ